MRQAWQAKLPCRNLVFGSNGCAHLQRLDMPLCDAFPRTYGPYDPRFQFCEKQIAVQEAPRSAAKPGRKAVPASFVEVIDSLVDVLLRYQGVQLSAHSDDGQRTCCPCETPVLHRQKEKKGGSIEDLGHGIRRERQLKTN